MQNKYIVNQSIRCKELRVVDDKGGNLGVIPTEKALEIAKEKQLDLLLIAPNANPPVARIVNFNKYLYDENRKERANKSKIKKTEIKELRMTPMTSSGDIVRLSKRAVQFMEDGNKVKVSVKMKGRQMAHPEVAREKINRMIEELSEKAKTEGEPKLVGSLLWVVFLSK